LKSKSSKAPRNLRGAFLLIDTPEPVTKLASPVSVGGLLLSGSKSLQKRLAKRLQIDA
jgi:hypothetical protein